MKRESSIFKVSQIFQKGNSGDDNENGGEEMQATGKKEVNTGALNVSNQLMKKLALEGSRDEWTVRIRHTVNKGTYKGKKQDGHAFEGNGLHVYLDDSMRRITMIKREKTKQAHTSKKTVLDQVMDEMDILLTKLHEYEQRITEEVSLADKNMNALYHEIETASFNATTGFQYVKELQTELRKRRLVKGEKVRFLAVAEDIDIVKGRVQEMKKKAERLQKKQEDYTAGWPQSLNDVLSGND
ncbi:hypothetical protein B1B05_06750 [Domibacillus enclensis]|uniref:Uncharacterized protein n=2 Tax=Domibacillus enclensis TaxID=1017273 RepID=A0ABX4E8X9_9BACI|nr:hypothetical protein B1B05_06750 [Domibacillus enclensis]